MRIIYQKVISEFPAPWPHSDRYGRAKVFIENAWMTATRIFYAF